MTVPPVRPLRSVLYVPADKERALEKIASLPADAFILDLEDAVAPSAKDRARRQALAALERPLGGGRVRALRVNGLDTPWGACDLEAAAGSLADAVVLPKVEEADAVREAQTRLAGAPASLELWLMIETPLGVLRAAELAASSPRVTTLVLGTADLAKDLHARHTRSRLPLVTALGMTLLAARAHGLAALDGVHLEFEDDEGFAASLVQGVEFGFDGKTLIHPRTIEATNRAFTPDAAQCAAAQRIVDAHAEAVAGGQGVTVVDGRLVEALHVEDAKRTLAIVDAIAARGR